jgi:hypothetical protein
MGCATLNAEAKDCKTRMRNLKSLAVWRDSYLYPRLLSFGPHAPSPSVLEPAHLYVLGALPCLQASQPPYTVEPAR